MTAQKIAELLQTGPITKERYLKLLALCRRMGVNVDTVIRLLPAEQQAAINNL